MDWLWWPGSDLVLQQDLTDRRDIWEREVCCKMMCGGIKWKEKWNGFMPAEIVVADVQRRSERAEVMVEGPRTRMSAAGHRWGVLRSPEPLPVHYADGQAEGWGQTGIFMFADVETAEWRWRGIQRTTRRTWSKMQRTIRCVRCVNLWGKQTKVEQKTAASEGSWF